MCYCMKHYLEIIMNECKIVYTETANNKLKNTSKEAAGNFGLHSKECM